MSPFWKWWPGSESKNARNHLIFMSNPSSENRRYHESYPGDLVGFFGPKTTDVGLDS
jgi:hypothetical protein